ncbi:glutathione S-transferase [Thozetella sp. PMI_491]|nr:glutathione S-transferase [Thozetella sp. PMI_491]
MTKPIKIWITPPGPNPWKAVFILEELGIPYELVVIRFDNVKKPPLTDINPNGRVPAIEDPNTGITLWESGAIYLYIVEQYDKERRLTYDSFNERHLLNQWLMFQVSGQGPYFGQCGWFTYLHTEKFQSAIDRYANEIKRVLSVLETALAKKPANAQWLVGDKMTFADMSFLAWNARLGEVLAQPWEEVFKGVPHVQAWHESMVTLPSWVKIMKDRDRLMEAQNLQWNGVPEGIETFAEYEEKIAAGEDTEAKD